MTPEDVAVHIARHDQRLEVVEQGVSNFRVFQKESREYYAEQRAVRKERQEREQIAETKRKEYRRTQLSIAGILAVILLPPASWVSAKVVHYVGDMYQMMQEWETVHKSEIQQKTISGHPEKVYAINKHIPQEAASIHP